MLLFFVDHKNDKKYFRSRDKFRQAGPDRAAETPVADAFCGLAGYSRCAAFTHMSIALSMTCVEQHGNQKIRISIKVGCDRRSGQASDAVMEMP